MATDLMVRAPGMTFTVATPAVRSQAKLVNAAILCEPHRETELVNAFLRGWEFTAGQLDMDGLPKAGELPRPTRGGRQ